MHRAVVLHRWPWQEHGLLLDLFSEQQGRFRAIAKYARSKRSPLRATLEPFSLIDIETRGRGEVKTMLRADLITHFPLQRVRLYSGLYVNELLQRLLPENLPLSALFTDYAATLALLASDTHLEPILRHFEFRLLLHLDLAFSFTHDAVHGEAIVAERWYRFQPSTREQLGGFIPLAKALVSSDYLVIQGCDIQQLGAFALAQPFHLKQFKRLMRNAYAPLLGTKPLRSRELLLAAMPPEPAVTENK